jgi:hypothetical protein
LIILHHSCFFKILRRENRAIPPLKQHERWLGR